MNFSPAFTCYSFTYNLISFRIQSPSHSITNTLSDITIKFFILHSSCLFSLSLFSFSFFLQSLQLGLRIDERPTTRHPNPHSHSKIPHARGTTTSPSLSISASLPLPVPLPLSRTLCTYLQSSLFPSVYLSPSSSHIFSTSLFFTHTHSFSFSTSVSILFNILHFLFPAFFTCSFSLILNCIRQMHLSYYSSPTPCLPNLIQSNPMQSIIHNALYFMSNLNQCRRMSGEC